ncbi:cadherin-like domain-containing protein [Rhizobium leguminosarum]|uniref:cadherin-like domain-containing protein n=1 Tax=Rhizobium leguminosarum TaxID=384 RepID=UPI001C969894|nr:cadherin-like domain-containing protein [Rhizobium leguminosarum]MBY5720068.1 cadherin-like domain-containing protein [Rhizobium leguminosarum]
MIEVKGTKSAKIEDNPHDRYVLKSEDKHSRVPLLFSLLLTGFALYLKSALSSRQEAPHAEQQPADDRPDAAPVIDTSTTGSTAQPQDEADEKAPAARKAVVIPLSSHKNAVSYPLTESLPIEFNRINLPSLALLKTFNGISVSFHASNDNVWTASKQALSVVRPPPSSGDKARPSNAQPATEKAANRAPRVSGPVTLADVSGCAGALIGLADLLRGSVDPDGDPMSIRDISVSSGRLVQTAGGWTYDAAMFGPVTITYQISDGKVSVSQIAQFSVVKPPPILGTAGDDLLVGSNCADDIDGRVGNDNIDARGGSDTVSGGDGHDNIMAGSGNDIVFAGDGDDVVLAGLGDDQIWGGAGNDRLYGEEGRDSIFGDAGDDVLSGGAGNDMLRGGDGHDLLAGDADNDVIDGEGGDDRLDGGDGEDILLGHKGTDSLDGGAGDDVLSGGDDRDTVKGDSGDDTIIGDADRTNDSYDGGSGIDLLDYSALAEAVEINLANGTASGAEICNDSISNFEIVRAGSNDDSITGSAEAEEIHGNEGIDHLRGGAGTDLVEGGDGDDIVVGDADGAADSYDGGNGIDTLDYSAAVLSIVVDLVAANASGAEIGSDSISRFEVIKTGEGDDILLDGEDVDCLSAGDGDDIVVAAADASDDDYRGEEGLDTIDYSQAAHGVLIDLNTGTATGFDVGQDLIDGFEKVVGGAGNDVVRVGSAAVLIEGGAGDDTFEFSVPAGESSADLVHQILDFMVGDRIDVSKYKIFEEVMDGLEERFENIYGEKADAEALPIRVRHEGTDELSQTFIEVDMDKDQHYEMTINLTGHHLLVIVENA